MLPKESQAEMSEQLPIESLLHDSSLTETILPTGKSSVEAERILARTRSFKDEFIGQSTTYSGQSCKLLELESGWKIL
jgi:hypothetical protein